MSCRTLRQCGLFGLLAVGCIVRSAPPPCPPVAGAAAAGSAATAAGLGSGAAVLGSLGAFKVNGEAKKVDVTTVAVTGQPFPQAIHAEIKESSNSEWTVQVQAPTVAAVE